LKNSAKFQRLNTGRAEIFQLVGVDFLTKYFATDLFVYIFILIVPSCLLHSNYHTMIYENTHRNNHKVIIIDWDDTILPSSFVDRWRIETFRDLPLHVSFKLLFYFLSFLFGQRWLLKITFDGSYFTASNGA
jgi:hypothetical protein